MAAKREHSKSPFYYVKQRFLNNKPAVWGLIMILMGIWVSVLGYLIMPDGTPFANDGAVQIGKHLPGYSCTVVKSRRNVIVDQVSWFTRMLFGQESEYSIIPIHSYKIEGFDVVLVPEGRVTLPERHPLISVVKAQWVGKSDYEGYDSTLNYRYVDNTCLYVDIDAKEKSITRQELIATYEREHLEKRTFWLGTDKSGRDMLSRLLFGTRISLGIGFVSVLISLFVGITAGAMGGFFGGKTDQFIMWLMTVVWSIPSIMLVIAISLALQSRGIWVAFVAVGLTTWVEIARVVRGQLLAIKEKTFVEAARALGIPNYSIIFKHILPNLTGPIIVIATSNFASAILTEAGLSFLGLGVQPPMPSWGMMINDGFHAIGTRDSWHLVVFPSVFISLLVLAFNLLGNGLRDAYDPQSNAHLA